MLAGVKADRLHLRGVGLAVSKRRFIDRAIDDLPDNVAVLLVHRDKLAFEGERQFVDDRSVDKFALGKIICLIAATMCITLGSGTDFVRNHFSFADSAETISAYQESVEQNISSN